MPPLQDVSHQGVGLPESQAAFLMSTCPGPNWAGTPELPPLATTPLAVPVHMAPVFHFECAKWKGEELECGEMDEEKVTERWRRD